MGKRDEGYTEGDHFPSHFLELRDGLQKVLEESSQETNPGMQNSGLKLIHI